MCRVELLPTTVVLYTLLLIPCTQPCPGTVEALYVFFQASTKRHTLFAKVQEELHLERTVTLKHLSDTRWACRVESLKALN